MSGCKNELDEPIYFVLNEFIERINTIQYTTIPNSNKYICTPTGNCKKLAGNATGDFPDCGPCDIPIKVAQLSDTIDKDLEIINKQDTKLLVDIFTDVIATGIADIYDIYFNFLKEAEVEAGTDKPNLKALEKLAASLDQLHPDYKFNLKPYLSGSSLTGTIREIVRLEMINESWIKKYASDFISGQSSSNVFKQVACDHLFKFVTFNKSISNGKMFFGKTSPPQYNSPVARPSTRIPFNHVSNFLNAEVIPSLTKYINIEYDRQRDTAFNFDEYLTCKGIGLADANLDIYIGHMLNKQTQAKIAASGLSSIRFSSFKEELDFLGYCGAYEYSYRVYIRCTLYDRSFTKEDNIEGLETLPYSIWNNRTTLAPESECGGLAEVYLAIQTEVPCSAKNYSGTLPIWPQPEINENDGTITIKPYYFEWNDAKTGFQEFVKLAQQLTEAVEQYRKKANKELNKALEKGLTNYGIFNSRSNNLSRVLLNDLRKQIDVLSHVFMTQNFLGINLPNDINTFLDSGYYSDALINKQNTNFSADELFLKNIPEKAFNFTTNVENMSILQEGPWPGTSIEDPDLNDTITITRDLEAYKNYTTDLANIEVAIERVNNYFSLLEEVNNTLHIVRDQIVPLEDPSSVPTTPRAEDPKEVLKTTILNFYKNFLSETVGSILTTYHGQKILDDYSNNDMPINKNSLIINLVGKQLGATNQTPVTLTGFSILDPILGDVTFDRIVPFLSNIRASIIEKSVVRNRVPPYDWVVEEVTIFEQYKRDLIINAPFQLSLVDNPTTTLNFALAAFSLLRALLNQKANETFLSIKENIFRLSAGAFYMDNVKNVPNYTLEIDSDLTFLPIINASELPAFYNFILETLFKSLALRKIASYEGCKTIVKEAYNFLKNRTNTRMTLPF